MNTRVTPCVLSAVYARQVQLFFAPPAALIPFIKSGKLKGLAVTADNRMTALPQAPSFVEAGLPSFELKSWYGVLAPAATPKSVVDKLSDEIGKALAAPDVKKRMLAQDMNPFISTRWRALRLCCRARVISCRNVAVCRVCEAYVSRFIVAACARCCSAMMLTGSGSRRMTLIWR